MDSRGALASPKEEEVGSRKRTLHVCAVSFIAISHRIYTKAHDLNGPIGTMLERTVTLASPVVCIAQYIFLAAISFLDDCILASEGIFGFIFPPSNYVFDRIEDLVRTTETLPKKFDVLMDKLPAKLHDLVPFLDWVLAHFIARLNFVVYNLATWGLEDTMKKKIIAKGTSKEDGTFQLDIGNAFDKRKGRVHPNSENRTSEEGENTKLSHDEKHVIHPDSKNRPRTKDVAAQPVSEKVSPEEKHINQPDAKNELHGQDVAAQPVSEKVSPEENRIIQPETKNEPQGKDVEAWPVSEHMVQPDATKNEPHSRDVAAQTVSEMLSHEEGRAGLAIEPIGTNQSSEEESRVCFTVQPSEEDPVVGMTVKAGSVGSNIVGLGMQPISRKGSYKEVLERGLTRDRKSLKDKIEHTRRVAATARGKNGRKNTSNFRRSASYT